MKHLSYLKAIFVALMLSISLSACNLLPQKMDNNSNNNNDQQNQPSEEEPSTEEEYFTVTWNNWDGSILEKDRNVPKGTKPSYDGTVPYRSSNSLYDYTFSFYYPPLLYTTKRRNPTREVRVARIHRPVSVHITEIVR